MYLQLFAQEKTEQPTQRRLERARERGQVFKSVELVAAITLLAAYAALQLAGAATWRQLSALAVRTWGGLAGSEITASGLMALGRELVLVVALTMAPLLGAVLVGGVAAHLLQTGFVFSLESLVPQFNRIDPIQGLQRLLSKKALVQLLKSLFKVSVVSYIAYDLVQGQLQRLPALLDLGPGPALALTGQVVGQLLLWVGLGMLVLAAADWYYQRLEYRTQLRMTKQEVKDELRDSEGRPEVRQRLRRRQRELARRRMMSDVARADVVVTNPTHYAVALRYAAAEMAAPQVLAKGQGFVALRIRGVAAQQGIPVVENPPLARALFAGAEVGDVIPVELYQAVAEVLAFVYRTGGRRGPA